MAVATLAHGVASKAADATHQATHKATHKVAAETDT